MNSYYRAVAFGGNHKVSRTTRAYGAKANPAAGSLGAESGRVTRVCARPRRVPLAVLSLLMAPRLVAVNRDISIDQYLHTSWTQEEGSALPPIQTLTQAAEGYLWLGTSTGLIRFDGMRFVEWSPVSGPGLPSPDIRCLLPASGGGLWVGTAAGACRVEGDRVRRYPAMDKLPCRPIISMVEDRLRGLWILSGCPNARPSVSLLAADGSLRTFGTGDGLAGQQIRALFQDRQGTLWIGTSRALCRWSPGVQAVCSSDEFDVYSIEQSGSGQLLITDARRKQGFRFRNGQTEAMSPRLPDVSFTPGAMVCDRGGNVWIGTPGQGLLRLRQNSVDRFTRNEGLSSNSVAGLVEDREGDLWVATARGIDRIRDPQVQIFSTRNGLSGDIIDAVYGAQNGVIWIGTSGGGVDRLDGERVEVYSTGAGLPHATVLSLYQDAHRRIWTGTAAGLAVQSGNRFMEVLTSNGQHLNRVFNIEGDPSGLVWVADAQRGLFVVRGGVACPVTIPESESADIYALLVARDGSFWLGHHGGGVTVIHNGLVKHYSARDGLGGGAVRSLYEDRDGTVWVGSGDGLSRFADGRWTLWTSAQGLPEGGVQSIVEDGSGALWLLTPAGVLGVSRNNLNGARKTLAYVLYGRTEGLRIFNNGGMSNPRMARASDGRLWVCTEDGVAVIDTAHVRRNGVPPPVVVEQVIVDGKPVDITSPGVAEFRGRDVQITYTGLSLMVPERVHFRYRMYDRARAWSEPGTQRNVTYVNLPPGRHRFQVIASNNDGVWNQTGAEMVLLVQPYFYQTTWFLGACVAAIALIIWSAHRLRMHTVVSRLQLILSERARVSRELHDSLLQGFAGVVYLLEAAARQFDTAPESSRQRLERALDQADQSLREAREMIYSMRIPALENSTLPDALKTTVSQMVSGIPVEFQFEVKGRVRQGPYDVEANVFLIAREAVTNSLNHSSATRIRSELRYTPKELRLTFQDDGAGFDLESAQAKPGHWGLRGMRERARQIGAVFSVKSTPGCGTRIDLAVPWNR